MVTTIVPAVSVGRREDWAATAALFVVGGTLGGIATGTVLGTVGAVLCQLFPVDTETASITMSISAFAYAFHELGFVRLPTLPIRRQVPRELRSRLPLKVVAIIYGLQLGAGVVTQISTAMLYVLCLAIVVTANPVIGGILMGCYGITRSLLTMIFSARLHSMEAAITRALALMMWQPVTQRVGASSLLIAAVAFGSHAVLNAL